MQQLRSNFVPRKRRRRPIWRKLARTSAWKRCWVVRGSIRSRSRTKKLTCIRSRARRFNVASTEYLVKTGHVESDPRGSSGAGQSLLEARFQSFTGFKVSKLAAQYLLLKPETLKP